VNPVRPTGDIVAPHKIVARFYIMKSNKSTFQTVWGVALLLAGIGVFIRVPQVMPKIESIEQFSQISSIIRFSFYFMGALLIGGGAKKIYSNLRRPDSDSERGDG